MHRVFLLDPIAMHPTIRLKILFAAAVGLALAPSANMLCRESQNYLRPGEVLPGYFTSMSHGRKIYQSCILNSDTEFGVDDQGRMYLSGSFLPRHESTGPPYAQLTYFADGGPNSTLRMQRDGNLVFRNAEGEVVYATNTSGNPGAYLYATDYGYVEFILNDSIFLLLPEGCRFREYLPPGGVIQRGEYFCNGYRWFGISPRGKVQSGVETGAFSELPYRGSHPHEGEADYIRMQRDGNLVAYRRVSGAHDEPVWASDTDGFPGVGLKLSFRGDISLQFSNGTDVWHLD